MMKRIILASASPRRKDLMERMGLEFDVVTSDAEDAPQSDSDTNSEKSENGEALCPAGRHALLQARRKAQDIAARYPKNIIVAADTLVALDGAILEKPRDTDEARRMLAQLSGRTHTVYTALVVIAERAGAPIERLCRADVTFAALSNDEIDYYISTGEPMDKAGAYGIQGIGMRYVTGICGDFYTVCGLPVHELYTIMRELGEI